jgi:hypothetical protein
MVRNILNCKLDFKHIVIFLVHYNCNHKMPQATEWYFERNTSKKFCEKILKISQVFFATEHKQRPLCRAEIWN